MDPDRVRAYLQVACAGLGFDIGEIWWSTNEEPDSCLTRIEEDPSSRALTTTTTANEHHKRLRFVQLYTSKSYENRRSMLVRPTDEEENYRNQVNGEKEEEDAEHSSFHEDSAQDLEKHVLSPTMVEAISKTAQVVWAHTRKSEGLTGRSDIRLQTAVGMPVAVDRDGNMCVVVMFSPNTIQSTDDALEYLQSISRSATSTSIPALLPAFDPKQGLLALPHHQSTNEVMPMLSNVLSEGVTTRFVPLDQDEMMQNNPLQDHSALSLPEVHSSHDLENAPRDCFGIPMLPSVAELSSSQANGAEAYGDSVSDAFDEASYGVWSTIMQSLDSPDVLDDISNSIMEEQKPSTAQALEQARPTTTTMMTTTTPPTALMHTVQKPFMAIERQERLQEFASAFLGVSVFELAEVWLPLGLQSDSLGLVTSVMSDNSHNEALKDFASESEGVLVKFWSGAVGRAYSSGNPVWSINREIFADAERVGIFRRAKIESALAVPVYSGKSTTPSFVFCCYSFVRTGSVPFVLKFVQQALRLLWGGLDKVEPHESVGAEMWREVAPADLGEMAADVEMQQHFMIKKRPIGDISDEQQSPSDDFDSSIAAGIASLETASGDAAVPSIYTGQDATVDQNPPRVMAIAQIEPIQYQTFESVQNHIQQAIQSVAHMEPAHQHVATNAEGSKRAHVYHPQPPQPQGWDFGQSPFPSPILGPTSPGFTPASSAAPSPLALPLPLPKQVMQPEWKVGFAPFQEQQSTMHAPTPDPVEDVSTQQYNASGMYSMPSLALREQPTPAPVLSLHSDEQYSLPPPGPIAPQLQQLQQQQQRPQLQPQPHVQVHIPMANGVNQNHSVGFPQYCVQVVENVDAMGAQTATVNQAFGGAPMNEKRCRIQGCSETAMARRPYCQLHSGSRMCEHSGCNKCAQGSTRFCIAHGGGRRCTFPGCDKGARDKFFCAAHGGGKRCKFQGCSKSAVGGSSLCTSHGGGRRCSIEGCDKSAQSSTKFCVKHGGGKKCSHPGCEKVARGRTPFCAAHGGGIRCKLAGCNRVAIGKLQLCRAHGGGSTVKQGPAVAVMQSPPQHRQLQQPIQVMLQPHQQAPQAGQDFQQQSFFGGADIQSV